MKRDKDQWCAPGVQAVSETGGYDPPTKVQPGGNKHLEPKTAILAVLQAGMQKKFFARPMRGK